MKSILALLALVFLPQVAQAQAINAQGIAQALTRQAGLEGRVLWIDATANLDRLSTRQGVAAVLERCRMARINTVVVEVKPLSGLVLYRSRIAPRLTEWLGLYFEYARQQDRALGKDKTATGTTGIGTWARMTRGAKASRQCWISKRSANQIQKAERGMTEATRSWAESTATSFVRAISEPSTSSVSAGPA